MEVAKRCVFTNLMSVLVSLSWLIVGIYDFHLRIGGISGHSVTDRMCYISTPPAVGSIEIDRNQEVFRK
jgi:uncharacterized membrane protein YuzA (DUF378 family)